jgi:hypothetical protein
MTDPAATAWHEIEQSELDSSGVTAGTGFGRSSGLRIWGKIFALQNEAGLVVKLPRNRVEELIESGDGSPWGPGRGKVMKEWVALSTQAIPRWATLVVEAREFVGCL